MKRLTLKKDRALGVSEKRTYDLPLDAGTSRFFLTSLIGLMAFLALLSVAAAYILTSYANQWQTGLEGRWTIEMPAIDENGELIPRGELSSMTQSIAEKVSTFHAVETVKILPDDKILTLIEPWFDIPAGMDLDDQFTLPLPALISLQMKSTSDGTAQQIAQEITSIAPMARLDRHEEWLTQLLKLTGTLRFTALIFTAIICTAGIVAIAGAMQSRLAEHKESIELLHLMGASDDYISRQFQRHASIIAAQGGAAGFVVMVLFMYVLKTYLGGQDSMLIPSFQGSALFWAVLGVIPFVTIALCTLTTRWTVLRTLRQML